MINARRVPADFPVPWWEMSSFSAKLERVRLPLPLEKKPSIDGAATTLPSDPQERLDVLRDRIAQILTKAPSARRLPRDPTQGDLPFARLETPQGPLYTRTKRLSAAHRVGRAPVSVGKEASAGMLALLALDPSLASQDPAGALYLDTETTGLSGGAGTVPFLIGLAWFEEPGSALVIEQLLLRKLGEEAPMLERFTERLARASMIVTYNGKSFDVPLLRSRFVLNRLPEPPPKPHLDLVHVARRIHRHRVPRLNLAHVESEVLGFVRTADIAGGEVCSRYTHFLRTGDDSGLVAVLDHNEWDLVAMAALVGLYGEPLGCTDDREASSPGGFVTADLPNVARTVRRAGSLDLAREIADRAVQRGGGDEAVRARGEIAKARGDKAQALSDFASLVDNVDDPSLRLDLAKLYEHHAKEPLRALALLDRGTGELPEALSRRRLRLEKKRDRSKSR